MSPSMAWSARLVRSLSTLLLAGCLVEYTVPLDSGHGSSGESADTQGCAADLVSCAGVCIDSSSDPEHCGGCGNACADDQVCDGGSCASDCSPGLLACSRQCVDASSDPVNCGRCGEVCDVDGSCVAGDCKDACNDACDDEREVCIGGECECRPELEACAGACVDLRTDAQNCGACGKACGTDPCGDFDCQPDGCTGFPAQCDDACTDLSSDPLHCGECDRQCDSDEACILGECEDLEDDS